MDDALSRHPIFLGADTALAAEVLQRVHPRWVPKGTMLATPGAGPRAVFLVLEGQLRSFLLTADGRRVILELLTAGGIDGLLPTIGLTGHFTEAAERSLVATLSPVQFDRLVRADPTIAVNIVTLATKRLATRENQLEALAVRDPARRVAAQLLALARTSGERIPGSDLIRLRHGITHQLLADMAGIRRETVTLHFGRLAATGAVETHGDHLSVDAEVLAGVVAGSIRLVARRPRGSKRAAAGAQ